MHSQRGNPNICAMSRKLTADQTDQYQIPNQYCENQRFAWSLYLMLNVRIMSIMHADSGVVSVEFPHQVMSGVDDKPFWLLDTVVKP